MSVGAPAPLWLSSWVVGLLLVTLQEPVVVNGQVLGPNGAKRFAAAIGVDHPNHVLGTRLGMHGGKNPLIAPGREHFIAGETRVAKAPTVHYHSKTAMADRKPGNARSEYYSLLMMGAREGSNEHDKSVLQWLLVNCPVTKQRADFDIGGCQEALPYNPPKPDKGTMIYVLYLFKQPDEGQERVTLDKEAVKKVENDFDVTKLSEILGTKGSMGQTPAAVNFYYGSATQEDWDAMEGQKSEL